MKKQQTGFTLIELMIVVAIIAILASIAIPAYQGYIKQGKISSLVANHTQAVKMVKAENAKIVAGGACTGLIADLNEGSAKAIGDASNDAFIAAAAVGTVAGAVYITGLDTDDCPETGTAVAVTAVVTAGSVGTDYPNGAAPTVSFTPQ